jgi:hypothetical protein
MGVTFLLAVNTVTKLAFFLLFHHTARNTGWLVALQGFFKATILDCFHSG